MKGKKTGGRQKGTPNKITVERDKAIAAAGVDPRQFILNGMAFYHRQIETEQAKSKPDQDKIAGAYVAGKEFAAAAAPYCHPRLQAIEHAGRIDSNVTATDARNRLAHLVDRQADADDEAGASRTTH